MKAIEILGGLIFVKDGDESDKYIQVYRAEDNCVNYRLKVDCTTFAPYYELYLDWKEGKRMLTSRLYASSKLEKIGVWITNNR